MIFIGFKIGIGIALSIFALIALWIALQVLAFVVALALSLSPAAKVGWLVVIAATALWLATSAGVHLP